MLIFNTHRVGWCAAALYFYLIDDIDPSPKAAVDRVIILSDDYKIAQYKGKYYRVCELGLDEGFIKVWEHDPFVGYDGYQPLPNE